MRRMLLTVAAALSAAIFLVSLVMWVRSYWCDDQLQHVVVKSIPSRNQDLVHAQHVRISSSRGKVALALMNSRMPHPLEPAATVSWQGGPSISRYTWTRQSDDLNDVRKASKELAIAADKGDAKAVRAAAGRLNRACAECHTAFR